MAASSSMCTPLLPLRFYLTNPFRLVRPTHTHLPHTWQYKHGLGNEDGSLEMAWRVMQGTSTSYTLPSAPPPCCCSFQTRRFDVTCSEPRPSGAMALLPYDISTSASSNKVCSSYGRALGRVEWKSEGLDMIRLERGCCLPAP